MGESEWRECELGDLMTLQRGFDLPYHARKPGRVPIVSSSGPSGLHSEAKCKAPGIVTGRYGTLGEVHFIHEDYWPHNTALYVKDMKGNDPRFLYYLLGCTNLAHHNDKSGVPGVNRNDLHKIEVMRPPLPEQRAIARVLGVLDNKIELNRRMNRTLEDLARGLFWSWFVDFDPVTQNRTANAPIATAGLFPSRLVDSPLGPIPQGWRVGTVADLCTTQYGYTASATDEAIGPRMLRVTDMNKEPWVEWADVPHCRIDDDLFTRYALKLGDVLVSRMADPGKAAIVEEVLPEGAVFASYLIRLATRSISASYYLFYYLRSDQYLDYAESVSGGTVQKNMNAQVITAAQMVIAPEAVADEFARLVRPWRAQISANLQQSRQLAALRNAILPQLLSGEIRLREAEGIVNTTAQEVLA